MAKAKTGKTVKKSSDARPAASLPAGVGSADVVEPTGFERKVEHGKVRHEVEVSIKVPGYLTRVCRIVDIDTMDAAERAEMLDHLVDELAEQF